MLPVSSRNVLICLRYGIGDLIMELPALSALRKALPEARITAIAAPPAHELLECDARVDRLVLTTTWGLRDRWDRGTAEARRSIAAWVAAAEFDLVLDAFHAVDAIGEAIWSLGVESLECAPAAERSSLEAGGSGVEALRAGVREGWGLDVPPGLQPRLRLPSKERAGAAALLRERGLADRTPFALSPVASHDMKRWPAERFAAVADHLVARGLGPVLILEGPRADLGRAVVDAMDRPGSAVRIGPHHLLRTAALLERCRGVVCNDTGIMHMAAAVGTPTVGVFGPTQARVYLPPGRAHQAVEPAGLDCPHRPVRSIQPPPCGLEGRCFIGPRSCVHMARTRNVIEAVDRIADRGQDEHGATRTAGRSGAAVH